MNKITVLISTVLIFVLGSLAQAVVYTGAMDNRSGFPFIPGFTGQSLVWTTGGDPNAGLRLQWQVDNESTPGSWTYTYRVLRGTAQNKGFAFFDIETASNFTAADILSFQVVSATDKNGLPIPAGLPSITLSGPVNFNAVHDFSNAAVTEASSTTALNKSEFSHYSGDPGRVPAGEPGGSASDTPSVGPVPHPFFGLRVTFPGSDRFSYTVTEWEFRVVANRVPMWGSFFGWGDQTAMSPFWYSNFYSNNIDNPARLALAAADSMTGAGPYQGWVLVPGSLPTVISTNAADGATGVPVTDPVTAVFSGEMDAATITPATFTLTGVTGTVSYDPATRIATFTPDLPLPGNSAITATITTGVEDLAGNAMAANKVWSFTTAAQDTVPPTVSATGPGDGATYLSVTARLTATFSEEIDPATLASPNFAVAGVTGTTSYNPATRTASFTPDVPLANHTTYTATIAAAVKDLAGNAMAAPRSWSFTTIPAETVLPMVTTTAPLNGSENVPATTPITATFSEAIDPATLTTANFSVAGVTGTVSFDAATRSAVFTQDAPLAPGTVYTATITTGIKDLAGNALPKPKVWSFTTSLTPPAVLPDGILIPGETRPTVEDALRALRIVVDLIQATQDDLNHGDVAPLGPDGRPQPDGKLDVGDALIILRKAVGLINW